MNKLINKYIQYGKESKSKNGEQATDRQLFFFWFLTQKPFPLLSLSLSLPNNSILKSDIFLGPGGLEVFFFFGKIREGTICYVMLCYGVMFVRKVR